MKKVLRIQSQPDQLVAADPRQEGPGLSPSLMAGGNAHPRQAWAQGQGQWNVSDLDRKLGVGSEASGTGEGPRGSGSEG